MLVRFSDVAIGYGHRPVLENINLTMRRGDYTGIVGPNGSGKTTLLKAILGNLRPMRGVVERAPGMHFGYVPQAQTMDEHFPLSVLDIVMMGRFRSSGPIGPVRHADRDRVMQALADVAIEGLAKRAFRDLSGGQRQRTLVARALASDPDALLLDEPTSDMDIAAEKATMELLDRLHRERGLLVVLVTHQLNVVLNHVRHVAILGDRALSLGPVEEIIRRDRLEQLYGVEVTVGNVDGKRVVL